jgi:ATP-dependent DNA ligase
MRKAFEPCIPTASKKVPDRPDWIHEIKQDGYRMIVVRDHDQVKLITRNGHDWTKRYPWIVEAARKIRSPQFVLDGEACILGVHNVADFDDLHSQKHNDEVQLYAFDLLSIDGDDLRDLPLHLRKNQLSRLLGATRRRRAARPVRTGRDRTGPVQGRLQHGPRGNCLEASGPALSRRPIAGLAQGEEPATPGDDAGDGS